MQIAFIIVILVGIIAVISTLMLAGKSDENYRSAAKKNSINLTLIYAVVIVLSLVAIAVYVKWFI